MPTDFILAFDGDVAIIATVATVTRRRYFCYRMKVSGWLGSDLFDAPLTSSRVVNINVNTEGNINDYRFTQIQFFFNKEAIDKMFLTKNKVKLTLPSKPSCNSVQDTLIHRRPIFFCSCVTKPGN